MGKANALTGPTIIDPTVDGTLTITSSTGSAAVLACNTGAFTGDLRNSAAAYTTTAFAGITMTAGYFRGGMHRYTVGLEDLQAGGASTTLTQQIFTLKAGQVITNMFAVVAQAAAGPGPLTQMLGSIGRAGAAYQDYVIGGGGPAGFSMMAVAGTVYGNTAATRGTNLTGYDLVSSSATTAFYLKVDTVGCNLADLTAGSLTIYAEVENFNL